MAMAIKDLLEIKKKYPNIILRIIALTDGEDTQSISKPETLVRDIILNDIIVDAFVVGTNCIGLKTIAHASQGRCYCPKDLLEGLRLFEVETIITTKGRP